MGIYDGYDDEKNKLPARVQYIEPMDTIPDYRSRFGGEGFRSQTRRPKPLEQPVIPRYKRNGGLLGKLLGPERAVANMAAYQQQLKADWQEKWQKMQAEYIAETAQRQEKWQEEQADYLAEADQPLPPQEERFPAMDERSFPTQATQFYPQRGAMVTAGGTVTGARICQNCGSLTSGTYCEFCGEVL